MAPSLLQKWFPGSTQPFIALAPMFGTSTAELASAVSNAGGFGFIGGGFDFSATSTHLTALDRALTTARSLLSKAPAPDAALPVGFGLITFHPSTASSAFSALLPILTTHRPAAVWLFAPDPGPAPHSSLVPALRDAGKAWGLRVFVQVGNVEAARAALKDGADGLVVQGIDAGGHQFVRGAGVVSLVPEVVDMVKREAGREVAVLAAGGIADGRGVAAALACGADGVVMGTRFIVADESPSPAFVKQRILETADGASTTLKTTVHDDLQGTGVWPAEYDGRAIVGTSYEDYASGTAVDEVYSRYKEALAKGDDSRRIVWAGNGIGLIGARSSAAEIVKRTQEEARDAVRRLAEKLGG